MKTLAIIVLLLACCGCGRCDSNKRPKDDHDFKAKTISKTDGVGFICSDCGQVKYVKGQIFSHSRVGMIVLGGTDLAVVE